MWVWQVTNYKGLTVVRSCEKVLVLQKTVHIQVFHVYISTQWLTEVTVIYKEGKLVKAQRGYIWSHQTFSYTSIMSYNYFILKSVYTFLAITVQNILPCGGGGSWRRRIQCFMEGENHTYRGTAIQDTMLCMLRQLEIAFQWKGNITPEFNERKHLQQTFLEASKKKLPGKLTQNEHPTHYLCRNLAPGIKAV